MENPRHVLARRIRQQLEHLEQRRQKLVHALEVIEDPELSGALELDDTAGSTDRDYSSIGAADTDNPLKDEDLSLSDAAKIVIRQDGTPLSVPEIADRLLQRGYPYNKDKSTLKQSLAGVLGRWARKGEEFFRPKKGKYAPIEWEGLDGKLEVE